MALSSQLNPHPLQQTQIRRSTVFKLKDTSALRFLRWKSIVSAPVSLFTVLSLLYFSGCENLVEETRVICEHDSRMKTFFFCNTETVVLVKDSKNVTQVGYVLLT